MFSDPKDIPIKNSILFRRVYKSEKGVINHLNRYLNNPYDTIAIFKHKGHLPDLVDVYQNIEIISSLQIFDADKKGLKSAPIPFKVISLLEQDWFLEVCAALGGVGGLASVIMLIRDINKDRALSTIQTRSVTRSVPTGGGFVQKKVQHLKENVKVTSLGSSNQYSIEKIADYHEKNLECIELYSKDGSVQKISNELIGQHIDKHI